MTDPQTYRVLDATLNRALEGLRVVEDFARFAIDDVYLTQQLKQLRHELAEASQCVSLAERRASRDTPGDVGTAITTESEAKRLDLWGVCTANLERVKQSLRSLEEFGKLVDTSFAARVESLRYEFYTIERILTLHQASCEWLSGADLCVLVNGRPSEAEFVNVIESLLTAGVPMIQLRDKRLSDVELVARGRCCRSLIDSANGQTIFIANDRPDVAAAIGADGVHLGQDDMQVADARKILGPTALIGVSTHTIEQARQAVRDGANYLGVGPTFPSTTKSFEEFPGLALLEQVADEIRLPVFAIGGINAGNLPQVLDIGISRVAVSEAILGANDVGEAVLKLRSGFSACRAG